MALFVAQPPGHGAFGVHRLAEQLAATARSRTLGPDDLPKPPSEDESPPMAEPLTPLVHS
jgi:hypothetical protein